MKKYILAIDQGTTSSRAFLFDRSMKVVSSAQQEFPQYFPEPGFVLHNPNELFESVLRVIRVCLSQGDVDINHIAGIAITNQRETTVVWKRDGNPIYPAIVWQSRQSAPIVSNWQASYGNDFFMNKTGLIPDAYFSSGKLNWILEHVPDARNLAQSDELLFGTIDSWLIWKLSGGKSHITDRSNASRTMLFNIHRLCWDDELCEIAGASASMLPILTDNWGVLALTDPNVCGFELPVLAIAGDQQAALFGQACFQYGEAKVTYGTGCFLLANTGSKAVAPVNGLLSTIAWSHSGETTYATEGSVFVGGSLIQWLRDEMLFIKSAEDAEALAMEVQDSGGVVVVPAFTGLGAPYWDADARGAIFGLSRGTTQANIMRASLESLAFQTADVLALMHEQLGGLTGNLKVDGGASRNNLLIQFQADILARSIERPAQLESTVNGVAGMAAMAVGWFSNLNELSALREIQRTFQPSMAEEMRDKAYHKWKVAVDACRTFK